MNSGLLKSCHAALIRNQSEDWQWSNNRTIKKNNKAFIRAQKGAQAGAYTSCGRACCGVSEGCHVTGQISLDGWIIPGPVCVCSHVIITGIPPQGMPTQHHTWSPRRRNGHFGVEGKLWSNEERACTILDECVTAYLKQERGLTKVTCCKLRVKVQTQLSVALYRF